MKTLIRRTTNISTLALALFAGGWALPASAQAPTDQPTTMETPMGTQSAVPQAVTATAESNHFDYGILGLIGLLGLLGLMRRGTTETVDYRRTPRP